MKTFKKFIGEEVAANAVGANPPDAVKVAGEPFKRVGNSITTLRRDNKKARIARNQARERQTSEFL